MRLVPKKKKSFILFIHQLKCDRLQSTSLVPAHTFSSGAATVCSIPRTQLGECRLRPALRTSGCLLLVQNGVLSLPILLFEIRRSRRREIRWVRRLRHHRNAIGCQKLRYRERCMGWRIVVVKDPVCGNVWTNPYDSLSESFKNVFVVLLIDCLSSGNPLFVNNTHGIKEAHKHSFHFWLGHACFHWPWWSLRTPFQTLAFGLWIILEKPTLVTSDNSLH